MKSGLYILKAIFGTKFSKNDRSTTLNTKNQIIFNSYEKSYKINNYQNQLKHENL